MDPIGPGEIGVAVGKAIPAFFSDAFDQFGVGGPQYLATGEPEGIVAQVGQAVGRSACRRYAAGIDGLSASAGQQYENACRPYLDTLNPGDGIRFETPFEGGQCDGVLYVGRYDYDTISEPPTTGSVTFRARGPISLGTGPIGPFTGVALRHRGAFPVNQGTTIPTCGQAFAPPLIAPTETVTVANTENGRIVSLSACTGLDDCGNPAPIVVQPRRRPDPLPPPFQFNPGPDIDIPINVEVNPDGSINVDFGGDPIEVDPFEPEPTDPGGGGGDPGDPTDPGSPGPGGDTGDGGTADGDGEPGQELVGVLVEILTAPSNPNTFDNNAATVYRGIGYVRMGFPGRLGTDVSGGVVISPQFFHAQQRGLTDWEVRANVGFSIRATPYYRDLEE